MARERDYILITDVEDERYLQIGEIIDVELYEYDNDVKTYRVRFADKEIVEYDYKLVENNICKVLMFERQ